MAPIKRIVVDILKPYDLDTIQLAQHVADLDGVVGANVSLLESDRDTQNVKLTIEGDGIRFEDVERVVDDLGGTIHSIDQVVSGERMIEDVPTPQD